MDPAKAKAIVLALEKEPERAQTWDRAGEMEWDPVWGLVLVPVLALELVQASETDQVMVQLLETDRITDQERELEKGLAQETVYRQSVRRSYLHQHRRC